MKRPDIEWQASEAAALNARRVLPQLVTDYFKAGRKLDGDSSARDMHRFRLKTKHLRYTLEAFTSLYGTGLTPRIASLRPVQNALGDANDCAVLLHEMAGALPHKVRSFVEKRASAKRKEFLRYWRKEFDAAGEEKKWKRYLARPVRVKPPQP